MKTLIAIATVLATAAPAFAQNYPTKPVRFISAYAPGGGTPEEFGAYIKRELKASADLVKLAHVKLD